MKRQLATQVVAALLLVMVLPVQAADFNDNDYHEYILYEVDTPSIDILIVPPASPYALRDMANIEQSIEMWKHGIDRLAPAWLADGMDIRYYTLGEDMPTMEAAFDPEIIIVSSEHNPVLLFGIGLQQPVSWCHGIGPGPGQVDFGTPLHQHESSQWSVSMAQCADGGKQCYVVNTNGLLWGADRMFDLNSHELGHCLGVGHVGDALDFTAQNFPPEDIMSYQTSAHVHCVSTLNILALEAVYAPVLGQGAGLPAGSFVHMNPSQYAQDTCDQPSAGILG